jgi:hypothetical protein
MVVGFQPGGTVNSVRVVLRPTETLPNKFNNMESQVFREDPDNGYQWVEIKPVGTVLPADSDLLSEPEFVMPQVLDLTIPLESGKVTYDHPDIIRFDLGADSEADSDRD